MQGGEGIVGDLGPCVGDGGEEGRLAGVGQADQAGISAISFSRSQIQRSSPGQPLSARRGAARLVDVL